MKSLKARFSYTSCFVALQILLIFLAVHREQHFVRTFYALQKAETHQKNLQKNLVAMRNTFQAMTTTDALQSRAQKLKLQKLSLSSIRPLYETTHH